MGVAVPILAGANVAANIVQAILEYNAQKRAYQQAGQQYQQQRQDYLSSEKTQTDLAKQKLQLQKEQQKMDKAQFSQNSLLGGYKLNNDMINRATDMLNNNQALAGTVLKRWGM